MQHEGRGQHHWLSATCRRLVSTGHPLEAGRLVGSPYPQEVRRLVGAPHPLEVGEAGVGTPQPLKQGGWWVPPSLKVGRLVGTPHPWKPEGPPLPVGVLTSLSPLP